MRLRDSLVYEAISKIDARIAEFWSQVDKNGPIVPHVGTPCWLWVGQTVCRGYGQFWLRGRQVYCHRLSWMLAHGDIPDGLSVCHECDNTLCVRDDHLFLGTHLENMQDRGAKGRMVALAGEQHPAAKLTGVQVDEIRIRRCNRKEKLTSLADEFNVSPSLISKIATGKSWTVTL